MPHEVHIDGKGGAVRIATAFARANRGMYQHLLYAADRSFESEVGNGVNTDNTPGEPDVNVLGLPDDLNEKFLLWKLRSFSSVIGGEGHFYMNVAIFQDGRTLFYREYAGPFTSTVMDIMDVAWLAVR